MSNEVNRKDNGNIEITLVLPWNQVRQAYEAQVNTAVQNASLTGFRKGKAPRSLVEPRLKPQELYTQVVQKLLPPAYAAALKTHHLKPLLPPAVSLIKSQPDQDWEILAIICEAPAVTLPSDYQTKIKVLKPPDASQAITTILELLDRETQIKIPQQLLDEETNRRLATLADNLTHLGITVDNYLRTKKLTPESLKIQTATQAGTALKIEFILDRIRQEQKLQDRKSTLDFLASLV